MASKTPPSEVLTAWLGRQRWYATKTRAIVGTEIEDAVEVGGGVVAVARVILDDGAVDRYALTLGAATEPRDALDDGDFCRTLLALVAHGSRARGRRGTLVGRPTSVFPRALPPTASARRIDGEQTNSSVIFDRALIMKTFRRPAPGPNPEEEMTRFLTERAHFANAPRLAGDLEYRPDEGSPMTLAVVQELVDDGRDGWQWMLDALGRFLTATAGAGAPHASRVRQLTPDTLAALRRLGEVTGELHRALATDGDPAFAPEPIGDDDLAAWARAVSAQLDAAGAVLGDAGAAVATPALVAALDGLRGRQKIRHHGDLHLGQTLYREGVGDFVLIDFEGEPLRPLAERRRKHAPIRDLAGLVRSVDYAAATSARSAPALGTWTAAWRDLAEEALISGYRAAARGGTFVPESEAGFARALAVFILEKAAYEIVYEANHRPDWVAIPRRGLVRAAAALGGPAAPGAAAGAA